MEVVNLEVFVWAQRMPPLMTLGHGEIGGKAGKVTEVRYAPQGIYLSVEGDTRSPCVSSPLESHDGERV